MDKLRAMRLIVRVVDAGSFTAVAGEPNVTTSIISKETRRVEEELGGAPDAQLYPRATADRYRRQLYWFT